MKINKETIHHPDYIKNDGLALRMVLSFLLSFIGLVLSILSLLTICNKGIHPAESRILCFLEIGIPFLFILNLFFVVLYIVRKKFFSIIFFLNLIASVMIGYNLVHLHFCCSIADDEDISSVKVLSYNVRGFNLFVNEATSIDLLAEQILQSEPDVVCLQEYAKLNKKDKVDFRNLLRAKYPYFASNILQTRPEASEGVAMLSKYPIIHSENLTIESLPNGAQICRIVVGSDTISVMNLHLFTTSVNQNGKIILQSEKDVSDNHFWNLIFRLFDDFYQNSLIRAEQANELFSVAQKEKYPLIICGDFNDTCFSYTYQKLSSSMFDSFKICGNGLGMTYSYFYRIDHILVSPEIKVLHHQILPWQESDHMAQLCEFSL